MRAIRLAGLVFLIMSHSCSTTQLSEPWPTEINYSVMSKERIDRIKKFKPKHTKIVMLGNSITEQGGNWNEKLKRDDVYNCGQGGYTTQQFSWLLDSCVFESEPEVCFIMGGINDFSLGVPLERIYANYIFLLEKIDSKGIRPIIQSTLYQTYNSENNPRVRELNAKLRKYCRKNDYAYINLNRKMSEKSGLIPDYSTDGTHLNDQGYSTWALLLQEFLKDERL